MAMKESRPLRPSAIYRLPPTVFCLLLAAICFLPAGADGQTVTGAVTGAVTVNGRVVLVAAPRSKKGPDDSNAVVWLTPLGAASEPAPGAVRRRFRLIQKNKQFDPHVLVVPVGAMVDFPNLDPFFHNVFSLYDGKRFDLGLYEAGTTHTVTFDRPGVSYLFCNIHPQMSAIVVALRTPYYGVSNHAGEVTIRNVPPGRYRLEIWDERALPATLKAASREVAIAANAASFETVSLAESASPATHHKNKYGRDYENLNAADPVYQQR
ncbi:MAG TPA: hypothetical protein VGW33_14070 [Terriglobia bacterium]|nr:hypothetical protein [Terriglobia bacterium]